MTDFRILSFAVIVLLLTAIACTTERPVVSTDSVSVAYPRAYVQSTVSADAVEDVLASGICFGTAPAPDLTTGTCTTADRGTGTFSDTISGLQNGSLYYVRAYATTTEGTIYGNALTFTPTMSVSGNGVTMDGHDYPTIVLGNGQEWMAENLRTSVYANGDQIPNIQPDAQWEVLQEGAWCHNENDAQIEALYGKLYNRAAIDDSRGVCPLGWHVAIMSDWENLLGVVDPGFLKPADNFFTTNSISAVSALMNPAATWPTEPPYEYPQPTGESGFAAMPGGYRVSGIDGNGQTYSGFFYLGEVGQWWIAAADSMNEFRPAAVLNAGEFKSRTIDKRYGVSVRCVKN